MEKRVGIYGIGSYLPEQVRRNDWWDEQTVEKWTKHQSRQPSPPNFERLSKGAKITLETMLRNSADPFKGSKERRVLSNDTTAVDMEVAACLEAIENANVTTSQIDLLLSFALVPDHLGVSTACSIHEQLGLMPDCLTIDLNAMCNSFPVQLVIAEQMINSGRAEFALLSQSSAVWRVLPPEEPFSVHFGDGATAVVVGPVSANRGILSQSFRTDGTVYRSVNYGIPGRNWWEDGKITTFMPDKQELRKMLLSSVDCVEEVVSDALQKENLSPEDIDFFACHQPTAWFQELAREQTGMVNAKIVDNYSMTGTLSAANIPLLLSLGEGQGMLKDNDLVASYIAGAGMTYSCTILRWGR